MPENRSAIHGSYIVHGHGAPSSEASAARLARVAWIGGGAGLIGLGLTRKSTVARWVSIISGSVLVAVGAVRAPKQAGTARTGAIVERMREAEWSYVEAHEVIEAPVSEVYRFVRNVGNWPRVFTGVKEAHLTPEGDLAWALEVPGERAVWWRGRIVEDYPDQLISWESASDSVYDEVGSMRLEKQSAGRTRVTLSVSFRVVEGIPGMLASGRLARMTEEATQGDLQVLKSLVEREMQPATRM